ncbi:MAG: tRNA (adenosine(37)-N6)-dimethylallyltransferase MiaA [Muribaculaceae bacterium]|nr:tRNA (adenosine(37)-N6)-dimethylallyltransferase MiaA [Muribaculaceae bacterium]
MEVNVVTGPTASGKTAAAIELAQRLGCEIISADSRQIFRGIPITTAAPTARELAAVRHHLVGVLELDDYYSAARFEEDALGLIADMERRGLDRVVVCGGSMMYINALLNGLDELPTISDRVRAETLEFYQQQGIDALRAELQRLDPDYLAAADPNNHRRLIHALEIIRESGAPVSQLRTGRRKQRPFSVNMHVLNPPRAELFDRINRRVEKMIEQGMLDEARAVYPLRRLNSLNTVGFKELFAYFDGIWDLPTAIARIQKNTRVYAKKQLTYLAKMRVGND